MTGSSIARGGALGALAFRALAWRAERVDVLDDQLACMREALRVGVQKAKRALYGVTRYSL
jgi:hypothetical protein